MTIEHRIFVGETATQIFDGWGGWRVGKTYRVRVTPTDGTHLRLTDADAPANGPTAGAVAVVTQFQYDAWWAIEEIEE